MSSEPVARLEWLAQTKFWLPVLPSDLVERAELRQALQKAVSAKRLTLISAPAGSGKTTLLASLPRLCPEYKLAWLELDDADNDPVQFVIALIGALRPLAPSLGTNILDFLAKTEDALSQLKPVSGLLINEINTHLPAPFIVALDDLHWIGDPAVYLLLDYLLERLPPQMRLVIASRQDPPLSLARLRARGQLSEIRLDQLRFSGPEIAAFFSEHLGYRLSENDLAMLLKETEGWAAALRMIASSLEPQSARTLDHMTLSRPEKHIFDYLAEEVLGYQTSSERAFLLETSILPELTPGLCEAVTGFEQAGALLQNLHRRNLFLTELDPRHRVYRYHDLFREFLQHKLAQERSPDHIRQLHRKAARAQILPGAVVRHWLAGAWWDEAAQAIEQLGEAFLSQGLLSTLRGWIEILPSEQIQRYPRLAYYQGRYAIRLGQWEQARYWLEQAQAGFEKTGLKAEQAECLMYLAFGCFNRSDFQQAEVLLNQAWNLPLSAPSRLKILLGRCFYAAIKRNWPEYCEIKKEGLRLALELDTLEAYQELAVQLHLADLFVPGLLEPVEAFCHIVLERYRGKESTLEMSLLPVQSFILFLRGQFEPAEQVLEQARQLSVSTEVAGLSQLDLLAVEGAMRKYRGAYAELAEFARATLPQLVQLEAARPWLGTYLGSDCLDSIFLGQWEQAQIIYGHFSQLDRSQERPEIEVVSLSLEAMLGAMRDKRFAEAETLLNQALSLQQELPYSLAWNDVRVLVARLYLAWERPEQARAVFDAVLAQARTEGIPGLVLRHGPAEFGPLLELAARRSEFAEYAASLLRLANPAFQPESGPVKVPGSHETLSSREVEVLRLLAARATNREIATQLVISETTVKSHVQHILQKLNLSSRTEAVASARELGLI